MLRSSLALSDVEARLRTRLAGPLPGVAAQARMAPRPRPGWSPDPPPGARRAAALVLLVPGPRGAAVVLTKRAGDLPHHAGQISLPGGALEADEAVEAAAVREAHEEVGVQPERVRVLGTLTPLHIPVSGFTVYPIVGVCDERPRLAPAPGEVERVIEVPLADLLDPGCQTRTTRVRDGTAVEVPAFTVGGVEVWGATAMILAELLALLGWPAAAEDGSGTDGRAT